MVEAAGWTGVSRQLLRRLRDVMAGAGSAQDRLDRIVRMIAAEMVAEVCSAYVRRSGDILELCATEGLRPEAVHRTRLRVGEGLVGLIAQEARPQAFADAQSHPQFAYRPETGEEIFHSLMGVPILRESRVLGVLVVQNVTQRHYAEEEIEALETIAMVLAELVASGELVAPGAEGPGAASGLPHRIAGVRIAPGIAVGRAVLHQPAVAIRRIVAEDPEIEIARLGDAVTALHSALDTLLSASDLAHGGAHRDVLEAFRMFAEDRGWLARIREAIRQGLTAEAAVQRVQIDTRQRLQQASDPYLRERLQDFEDLAARLHQHLAGAEVGAPPPELPEDAVLVARDLGPAELLDYDRSRLRAVVLEEGSPTAHVAIVARALDIPVVGRAKDALARTDPLDPVIVDGDNATVLIRPGEEARQTFAAAIRQRDLRRAAYQRLKDLPSESRDGVRVSLNINAGLLLDLAHLDDGNADGVGLYRTEIPFMIRSGFPDVAAQEELYRQILGRAGDRPVVFRTLDVGGDKLLPYFAAGEREDNPAMGWRAVRIALDWPLMLRQQLRALIRAAAGKRLRVMFPMIAEVAEFDAARRLVDRELERAARRRESLPLKVAVGAMIEVPALAFQLPALLSRADFLSVGSNDLMQFLFAADRGSARVAERYDALSPPVLAFLARLLEAAEQAHVPIALCGEMAGRPLEAMALVGLGFRSLSMAPPAVGPVKEMLRALTLAPLRPLMRKLAGEPAHSVRETLRGFARDHGVPV